MRSTMDVGLEALVAPDSGAGSAAAILGAVAVGAVALGVVRMFKQLNFNTGHEHFWVDDPEPEGILRLDRARPSRDPRAGLVEDEYPLTPEAYRTMPDYHLDAVESVLRKEAKNWRLAMEVAAGERELREDDEFDTRLLDIVDEKFFGLSPEERQQHMKDLRRALKAATDVKRKRAELALHAPPVYYGGRRMSEPLLPSLGRGPPYELPHELAITVVPQNDNPFQPGAAPGEMRGVRQAVVTMQLDSARTELFMLKEAVAVLEHKFDEASDPDKLAIAERLMTAKTQAQACEELVRELDGVSVASVPREND